MQLWSINHTKCNINLFDIVSQPYESLSLIKLTSIHTDNKFWVTSEWQYCSNAKYDPYLSTNKTVFYFLSRGRKLRIGHQLITRVCAFLWRTCYDIQLPRD